MDRKIILGFIILLVITACGDRYRYNRLVEKELATGIRHDSLFLGISFGMSQKEFYTHCWQMNKQGLIRQGPGNATVLYEFKDLKEPAEMNFYPKFHQGRIWKMPVRYNYTSWAPWNTRLCSDSLVVDLVQSLAHLMQNVCRQQVSFRDQFRLGKLVMEGAQANNGQFKIQFLVQLFG